MKKVGKAARPITMFLCLLSMTILASSCATDKQSYMRGKGKKIAVEINYGDARLSRTIETSWMKGRTALEVLLSVAEVKTHPVNEHVFVTSIDGVEGKRGDMAWYYTVNGKPAKKLAYSYILTDANSMKWEYRKDVCSKKVDK